MHFSAHPSPQPSIHGIRGTFVDLVADPFYCPESDSVRYLSDGLLVLESGKIKAFGPYDRLADQYGDMAIASYTGSGTIIMPGFIDTHIHYPQTEMIAAYGEQLLEWLNRYTFPTEQKFQDKGYARQVADIFCDELLRNGTTTAMVFATVFPQSVDALFEAAEERNLCMIAGKVMMDRNAPDALCDTAQSSYQDTKALIQTWHNKGRLHYAVTPRFAITSTGQQLQLAGQLLQEFPDVYLHTHLSENMDEVAWVKQLFPQCNGYLDAYAQAGLVGARSVFAHSIHLIEQDFQQLSEAGAAIAFCPTSNLFLGSGLFKIEQAKSQSYPVNVGLGTDVGAGTSFSILQTASEAYKVAQLRQQNLSPFKTLFLATLGGARSLRLQDRLGNFEVGKDADFIVLDPRATPLMAFRNRVVSLSTSYSPSSDHQSLEPQSLNSQSLNPRSLEELGDRVFSLMMMGDDRAVKATYVLGQLVYERSP